MSSLHGDLVFDIGPELRPALVSFLDAFPHQNPVNADGAVDGIMLRVFSRHGLKEPNEGEVELVEQYWHHQVLGPCKVSVPVVRIDIVAAQFIDHAGLLLLRNAAMWMVSSGAGVAWPVNRIANVSCRVMVSSCSRIRLRSAFSSGYVRQHLPREDFESFDIVRVGPFELDLGDADRLERADLLADLFRVAGEPRVSPIGFQNLLVRYVPPDAAESPHRSQACGQFLRCAPAGDRSVECSGNVLRSSPRGNDHLVQHGGPLSELVRREIPDVPVVGEARHEWHRAFRADAADHDGWAARAPRRGQDGIP